MQVNYVREHERFIEYAADEKIPANAQLLWYALMHIFNQRAEGSEWPDGFIRINNDRLFMFLPIKWDAMAKARNALKQAGLIDFRNGNRNKSAPEYRLFPFYPLKTDNTGGNTGGNAWGNTGGNEEGKRGDFNININDNKQGYEEEDEDEEIKDDDDARARISHAFRTEVGRNPLPAEIGRLCSTAGRWRFSAQMVALAIHVAAGRGAGNPVDYALTVLDDWRKADVRQPHQVDEYQVEYLRENEKCGLSGTGDAVEDVRIRDEARERRRQENLQAGIA